MGRGQTFSRSGDLTTVPNVHAEIKRHDRLSGAFVAEARTSFLQGGDDLYLGVKVALAARAGIRPGAGG